MKLKLAVLAVSLFLGSAAAHADFVNVSLGESNENFVIFGQGDNGSGYGTFQINLGSCVMGGSTTTCTLTGNYTGTTPGYTSGTWALITTYANGEIIHGITGTPGTGASLYAIDGVPSDTNSTLTLNDVTPAVYTVPLIVNGALGTGSIGFSFVNPSCSGVSPCTYGSVGLTPGSNVEGQVSGSATFNVTTPTSTPEPEWLALGGLLPGALAIFRRRFIRSV